VDSMPMLRLLTRKVPPGLLRDVAVAGDAPAQSLELIFAPDGFVVERPSGRRRAAYGPAVDLGGVRFAVTRRPDAKAGRLEILSREAATSRLLAELRVKLRLRTDIVDVTYAAADPRVAQQVVNRVVDIFRATSAEASQQQSRRRREFLEAQLRVNDSLLADARQALTAFHRDARAFGSGEALAREQIGLPLVLLRGEHLHHLGERLRVLVGDTGAGRIGAVGLDLGRPRAEELLASHPERSLVPGVLPCGHGHEPTGAPRAGPEVGPRDSAQPHHRYPRPSPMVTSARTAEGSSSAAR